jgi:hypothetical protein
MRRLVLTFALLLALLAPACPALAAPPETDARSAPAPAQGRLVVFESFMSFG